MQRARDWWRQAQGEWAAAQDLYRTGHWAWVCFTCQQAAEKALKALCEHFRRPQFGHNLNDLLRCVANHTEVPKSVQEACARLNRYYIPTRYPNAFDHGAPVDQFLESDAREALTLLQEVMKFVQDILGEA